LETQMAVPLNHEPDFVEDEILYFFSSPFDVAV
jgi:hypothetical protein